MLGARHDQKVRLGHYHRRLQAQPQILDMNQLLNHPDKQRLIVHRVDEIQGGMRYLGQFSRELSGEVTRIAQPTLYDGYKQLFICMIISQP